MKRTTLHSLSIGKLKAISLLEMFSCTAYITRMTFLYSLSIHICTITPCFKLIAQTLFPRQSMAQISKKKVASIFPMLNRLNNNKKANKAPFTRMTIGTEKSKQTQKQQNLQTKNNAVYIHTQKRC